MVQQSKEREGNTMAKVRATNIEMLNALRAEMSLTYQDRIPTATQENLESIYTDLTNFQPLRNELISALVKQIGLITIDSMFFNNPLTGLKKDPMRFGSTHEEIMVNMIKGTPFDNRAGIEKAFAIYESSIMASYHKVNFEMQYPVTVTYQNYRSAFTSEYGIRDLISAKVQQAFSSANYDEYLAMKEIIEIGVRQGMLHATKVVEPSDSATSDEFLATVKELVGTIRFPNPLYNLAGATSFSMPNTLVFITTPKINAKLGVHSLAYMFNRDEANIDVQTIIVDKFEDPTILGVLCDIRFFNVREQFREFTDNYNGASLNWNYFYTVVEMISASPFYPCTVLTTKDVSVTGITVTGSTNYVPASEIKLDVKVEGVGGAYVPQEVDLTLTGNTDSTTALVSGTSVLIVGKNEKGTLSITGTSRVTPSITKTVTIAPTA